MCKADTSTTSTDSSSLSLFELKEQVVVNRGSSLVEGEVTYIGDVQFDDEHDDWIGICLNDASSGAGENDGSVQGIRYFSCAPGCGLLVRASAVSKRPVTSQDDSQSKTESLEEKTSTEEQNAPMEPPTQVHTPSSSSNVPTASPSPSGETVPARIEQSTSPEIKESTGSSESKEEPSTTAKGAISVNSSTLKSKREKLRQRQAALLKRKAGLFAGTAAPSAQVPSLRQELQKVTEKLRVTEVDAASLRQQLHVKDSVNAVIDQMLRSKEAEITELTEKLRLAEMEVAEMVEQLCSAETDVVSWHEKVYLAEQEALEAKKKIAELEATIKVGRSTPVDMLHEVAGKLQVKEMEAASLRRMLSHTEKKLSKATTKISELESIVANQVSKVAVCDSIQKVQKRDEKFDRWLEETLVELSHARDEVQKTKKKVAELESAAAIQSVPSAEQVLYKHRELNTLLEESLLNCPT